MRAEEPCDRSAAVERAGPGERAERRVGVEAVCEALDPIGRGPRVGVEPADDVAGRGIESARCRAENTVFGLDHGDGAMGRGDGLRVVGRSVVDDDHLVGGAGLRCQIGQAAFEHPGVVQRRNDDTDGAHHCRA